MTTIKETVKRAGPWPRDPRAPKREQKDKSVACTLWTAKPADFARDLTKGGTPNYPDGSQQEYDSWEKS